MNWHATVCRSKGTDSLFFRRCGNLLGELRVASIAVLMFVQEFRHLFRSIHTFEPRRGIEHVLNRREPVSVEDQESVKIETSYAFAVECLQRVIEGRNSSAHVCLALGLTENHQARHMGSEYCSND